MAMVGAGASITGQVRHEGFADLGRQREPFAASALASHNELPGPPVHVSQFQPRDLDRAQPQPGPGE